MQNLKPPIITLCKVMVCYPTAVHTVRYKTCLLWIALKPCTEENASNALHRGSSSVEPQAFVGFQQFFFLFSNTVSFHAVKRLADVGTFYGTDHASHSYKTWRFLQPKKKLWMRTHCADFWKQAFSSLFRFLFQGQLHKCTTSNKRSRKIAKLR